LCFHGLVCMLERKKSILFVNPISENLSAPNWEESWERVLNLAKRPNNPCFRKLHHVCTQVFSMKLVDYIKLRYATTIPFFMQVYATTFFIYKDRIFFLPFILYIYLYNCNKRLYFRWGVLVSFNKICVFLSFHFLLTFTYTKQSSHILPSFYSLSFLQQSFLILSFLLLSLTIQTKSKN